MNGDYIYSEIRNLLINYENSKDVKGIDRSTLDLTTYYKVGKLLTSAVIKYNDEIILYYAENLVLDVDKKYTENNLKKYRYFYLLIENGATLSFELKWSHYVELLHLNVKKANYYIYLVKNHKLSIRELRSRLKNSEYDKLFNIIKSNVNEGIRITGDTCIKDFVKNPLVIRNSLNSIKLPEYELQNLILDDIKSVTSKLNTNFSFIGIEYSVVINNNYYNIDLLLYSVKYNCYIVIELKSSSFNSDYIFQLDNYMEYVDDNIKLVSENKTVGLVVVRKDNRDEIVYCTDNRILIREDNLIK